jgi:hypothetical protein
VPESRLRHRVAAGRVDLEPLGETGVTETRIVGDSVSTTVGGRSRWARRVSRWPAHAVLVWSSPCLNTRPRSSHGCHAACSVRWAISTPSCIGISWRRRRHRGLERRDTRRDSLPVDARDRRPVGRSRVADERHRPTVRIAAPRPRVAAPTVTGVEILSPSPAGMHRWKLPRSMPTPWERSSRASRPECGCHD